MKRFLVIVLLFLCIFLNAEDNYSLWKVKDTKGYLYLAYVNHNMWSFREDLILWEKAKNSNWAIIQVSERNYDLVYFEKGIMYKLVSYEMSRDRSALRMVNFYKEIFDKFFEKEPFYSFLAIFNIFSDLDLRVTMNFNRLSVDDYRLPLEAFSNNCFIAIKFLEEHMRIKGGYGGYN